MFPIYFMDISLQLVQSVIYLISQGSEYNSFLPAKKIHSERVIEIISMLTYALFLDLTVCLCIWYLKMGIFLNVRQAPISLALLQEVWIQHSYFFIDSMDISSRFFKLLLKIGNISFSEVVAPVECEQPKDGNVVPPKEPDHHGNRSQEAAASTTKGKRNRKSNVEMEC